MPRRALRVGLIIVAILVVLVIGAGAVFLLTFNPNELKPRVIAAVKQATGRDLTLKGDIGLKLSLAPTVEVSNVSLSNAPGFSPPEMATLQKLDLQLAILPLLHHSIEINRLVLVQPDIHLETNAQGRSNWEFTPQSAATAPAPSGPSEKSTPTQISVAALDITNGLVTYRDGRTGKTTILKVQQFASSASSPSAPTQINLTAEYDGVGFNLAGAIGPLARLREPASTTPWPINVTLQAAGAKVGVNGTLTHPLQGRGYALTVQGSVPDLATLGKLAPGTNLPPVHDLSFNTKVADTGGAVPQVSDLTLHVGASDLGSIVAGLKIDKLDVSAPRSDQPMQANGAGTFGGGPFTVAATLGSPASLKTGPFPVDVKAQAAGGNFAIKGAVAHPQSLGGVGLGITAQVADLATLSPLVGHALPAIKTVALQAELNDAAGGFRQGATLRSIKLTTADGDLSGEAGITLGQKPTLTAKLASTRIDADALMAAAGRPVQATHPAGAPPPAKPASSGRLFSDSPLPFDLLRLANADIAATVQDLHSGGADYRALNVHAVLRDGRLRVDPFAADLPGGHMSATLSADASQGSPPVAMTIMAPGLEVTPLLSAAGLPAYASGKLEIRADLHGAGASPHAIAADLNGTLGLAMPSGTVDTALLNNLLGGVLAKANLLGLVAHGGSTELRCFAARAVAQKGIATINPLLLSTAAMTMDGGGSANLGAETLDLTVRPQARIGGTGMVVPVRVAGPIRSPNIGVNALGAVQSNAGTVAGAVLGGTTPLGALGGALLGGKAGGGSASSDSCPEALALARGEAAPAAAARPAAAAPSTQQKPPNAGTLLKQLFH